MKLGPELKRLLGKANRLQLRTEMTNIETPREGYVPAMSGFVDGSLWKKTYDAFEDLVRAFPEIEYCRYLRAGFLMNSGRYREAEEAYLAIANGSGGYQLPAHLMLVIVYWHSEGKARAQRALDLHNELARRTGQPVHHVNVSTMFAG